MKISDYPKIQTLNPNDTFLVDQPGGGTKGLIFEELKKNLSDKMTQDEYYDMLEEILPFEQRLNVFRGKNLGSEFTDEQKQAIRDGTFHDLWLGDHWSMDGPSGYADHIIYRIVDFDYYYEYGMNWTVNRHHVSITTDKPVSSRAYNDSETTAGLYINSKMKSSGLNGVRDVVLNHFGSNYILIYSQKFANVFDSSTCRIISFVVKDADVELGIMTQFFGFPTSQSVVNAANGFTVADNTLDTCPFRIINIWPRYAQIKGGDTWLQDILSTTSFRYIYSNGGSGGLEANKVGYIRPVFHLIGEGR